MDTVQLAAATIINQVIGGRNLTQALSEKLNIDKALTQQQRGALQDICYGTLRFYGQLHSVLQQLLNKPLLDTRIKFLLLAALYQLQYSKAAQHAVVDFAVRAARQLNPATGGLVNAVLRNFLRQKDTLLKKAAESAEGKYSYPAWWIRRLQTQYGAQAEAILLSGNQHPPMMLRVNRRQTTTEEYLPLLQAMGIAAELIEPGAVLLQQAVNVDKLPGFHQGAVTVQDAGAQYAAQLLDVKPGMRVLDACAAPGGKTTHMLELADIELQALDKDEHRLQRVRENVSRLGLQATIVQGDAAEPAAWWDGQLYQRILADVPCSASGVVRRHPDIKWLRREADITGFAQQQAQILAALWPLLAAGGKLLYATCSVFDAENQQVLAAFLASHADARQLPLQISDMIGGQLLPNDRHDGFFYGLIQKLPA